MEGSELTQRRTDKGSSPLVNKSNPPSARLYRNDLVAVIYLLKAAAELTCYYLLMSSSNKNEFQNAMAPSTEMKANSSSR